MNASFLIKVLFLWHYSRKTTMWENLGKFIQNFNINLTIYHLCFSYDGNYFFPFKEAMKKKIEECVFLIAVTQIVL